MEEKELRALCRNVVEDPVAAADNRCGAQPIGESEARRDVVPVPRDVHVPIRVESRDQRLPGSHIKAHQAISDLARRAVVLVTQSEVQRETIGDLPGVQDALKGIEDVKTMRP